MSGGEAPTVSLALVGGNGYLLNLLYLKCVPSEEYFIRCFTLGYTFSMMAMLFLHFM